MQEKWSRDWEKVNWSEIDEKIQMNEIGDEKVDVGITAEEFIEYMKWLRIEHPDEFFRLEFGMLLMEKGMSKKDADFLSRHPDAFLEAVKMLYEVDLREGESENENG